MKKGRVAIWLGLLAMFEGAFTASLLGAHEGWSLLLRIMVGLCLGYVLCACMLLIEALRRVI